MKLSDLSRPVALAVLVCLAITVGAQDAPSSFDADSFFGGGDQVKPAASEPEYYAASLQPSGLVLTGEASTDLAYSLAEPFDSSARSGGFNGVSSLRLDATGGDRNEAKIEASKIGRAHV